MATCSVISSRDIRRQIKLPVLVMVASSKNIVFKMIEAENDVRGYNVKVKRQTVSYQYAANKRSAIAEVIARSLTSGYR